MALTKALGGGGGGGAVSSVFTRTGAVVAASGDYAVADVTGAAPLASPAFTGTPEAPTAGVGTNTTQIATTAFVLANAGGVVTPSARYWRINTTNTQNGSFVAIAEIEMRATIGGADQCSGGTASASTSFSGSFLPANAFDNSNASFWNSGGLPAWIQYDFGSATSVAEIAITARPDASYPQSPGRFDVLVSSDGNQWYIVRGFTVDAWASASQVMTFALI